MALHPIFQGISDAFMPKALPANPADMTPSQLRQQLERFAQSNEVGDAEYRSQLYAALAAADEVFETDPAKMLVRAEALERWASEYETSGKIFQAKENRDLAARYRRCAARAQNSNDNANIVRAA